MNDKKTFAGLLEYFKASEDAEMVMPMLDDNILRNAVVSWQSVEIKPKDATDEPCPYTEGKAQWNWMWTRIQYDQRSFGIVAGIAEHKVNDVLTRLMGLRLIYPDGTINSFAKNYLRSMVAKKFGQKKKSKKDEPEEE
jgi:hypothetical protein